MRFAFIFSALRQRECSHGEPSNTGARSRAFVLLHGCRNIRVCPMAVGRVQWHVAREDDPPISARTASFVLRISRCIGGCRPASGLGPGSNHTIVTRVRTVYGPTHGIDHKCRIPGAWPKRHKKHLVFVVIQDRLKSRLEALQPESIEKALEHRILESCTEAFQNAGNLPQPFGVRNIVTDQVSYPSAHRVWKAW